MVFLDLDEAVEGVLLTKINVRDVFRRVLPVALMLTGTVFVLLPVALQGLGDSAAPAPSWNGL